MATESSLTLREKLTFIKSRVYCCKASLVRVHRESRRWVDVPLSCKTWGCAKCGPRLGRLWLRRIIAGNPERCMTLSCHTKRFLTPRDAALKMKAAFEVLVRRSRATFGVFEYTAVWELFKNGYPHLHILQKGTYLPQKWLSRQWDSLGVGYIVNIKKVHNTRQCSGYVAKYLLKGARRTSEALRPMRLVQVSRGYSTEVNTEAPMARDPGWKTVFIKAEFGEILDFLVVNMGSELTGENDDGSVEGRGPPDLSKVKATEPWQYKILELFKGDGDGESDH